MSKFVFLTEAEKNRGFGHFMRSGAVASFLLNKGFDVDFFLDCENELFYFDFLEIKRKNWLLERGFFKKIPKDSVIFVDSYDAGEDFFDFLTQRFENVVVFDDFDRIDYKNSAVVNPNLAFEITEYKKNKTVIGGGEYVVLREEFFQFINKFKVKEEIKKVLITLGGDDNHEVVPKILDFFKNLDYKVSVVSGNDFYASKLKFAFKDFKIFGKLSAYDMAKMMSKSDLVISGAGQTLNELAFLGIPTIAICVGDDQIFNLDIFYKKGFLKDKIFWNDDLNKKILNSLNLLNSIDERKKVSTLGKSLISKNGVKNVANVLINKGSGKCWFLK